MLNICKQCATIRGMGLNPIQKPITCDLCGTKQMCCSIPVTDLKSPEIAFESGYFHSDDLSKSIALVKSRKAVLLPRIKMLQLAVSKPVIELSLLNSVNILSAIINEPAKKAVKSTDSLKMYSLYAAKGLKNVKLFDVEVVAKKIASAMKMAIVDEVEFAVKDLMDTIRKHIEEAKVPSTERATKKLIEQNLNAELAGLNEKEKELSVLFQNCIDRILLNELRLVVGGEVFNKAFERSKKVYKAMQK